MLILLGPACNTSLERLIFWGLFGEGLGSTIHTGMD